MNKLAAITINLKAYFTTILALWLSTKWLTTNLKKKKRCTVYLLYSIIYQHERSHFTQQIYQKLAITTNISKINKLIINDCVDAQQTYNYIPTIAAKT